MSHLSASSEARLVMRNQAFDIQKEGFYAREDVAFNAWIDARRDRLARFPFHEELRELVRSAFRSGVRFGETEARR